MARLPERLGGLHAMTAWLGWFKAPHSILRLHLSDLHALGLREQRGVERNLCVLPVPERLVRLAILPYHRDRHLRISTGEQKQLGVARLDCVHHCWLTLQCRPRIRRSRPRPEILK